MKRWLIPGASVASVLIAVYVAVTYKNLELNFTRNEDFVPNRFFSDAARVTPPVPRSRVEEILRARGYAVDPTATVWKVRMRPADYPLYLLPDKHPQVEAFTAFPGRELEVELEFDSTRPQSMLHILRVGGKEVEDVYFEPELIATFSKGSAVREIRTLVKFAEIPASVWKSIIAIEDQHFMDHLGFDVRGLLRALWVNLRTLSLAQGGSTITNQLVKNLNERRGKNVFAKANEILLAIILEVKFTKEEILEKYLNEVYLGQVGGLEVHGVSEGAQHFFGKKLGELSLAEVALLAGVIRGPFYYSPYRHLDRAIERQKLVLQKMVETGQIAEEEAKAAAAEAIRLAPPQRSTNKAPFFVDFVKAELARQLKDRMPEEEIEKAGFRIYTTLDPFLNTYAQLAVEKGVSALETQHKLAKPYRLEGALASVDQANGYVRALVGGRSYADSNFNRVLNMKRQVGSTFKPVVYLAALLKGKDAAGVPYGPAYPMEDAPWTLHYDRDKQKWTPKNYEKEHLGWVPLRTALARSVNTVAAKLGYSVGLPAIIETARKLGIESPLPEVPALALGVAELTPVELLQIYATIANHGERDQLTVIRGITRDDGTGFARFVYHPTAVLPTAPCDLVTDMLTTVFAEGTAKVAYDLGLDRPAAGKTGTTSHHRDAWFAGYTPQMTTVVWVGMDQVLPENDPVGKKLKLTGAGSALPIWVDFMKKALEAWPAESFPISPVLGDLRIDRYTGRPATSSCPDGQILVEKYPSDTPAGEPSCEIVWPSSPAETHADF